MRHKEINFINLPAPIKYIYDFAKSNLSQKLKERFVVSSKTVIHSSDYNLYLYLYIGYNSYCEKGVYEKIFVFNTSDP